MKPFFSKFNHGVAAFLVTVIPPTTAHAEDTEIFFNTSSSSIRPNILFILDNSGSMDTKVSTTSTYDSATTYSGPFDPKYIYVDPFSYWGNFTILTVNNRCDDLTKKLANTGQYIAARAGGWTNNWGTKHDYWGNLDGGYSGSDNRIVECQADSGTHGAAAGDGKPYAANKSAGPWSSNSSKSISWGSYDAHDFYSANYLNWYKNYRTTSTQTRLEIVQDVTKTLADSMTGVNIGLMSFNPKNTTQGGIVQVPVEDVSIVKTTFKNAVDALHPDTWTPLSETLHEAMLYYKGDTPYLGGDSVASAVGVDGKYKSPIASACQANNIILLTDGEPTYDGDPSSSWYDSTEDAATRTVMQKSVGTCTNNCLDEISKYMFDNDIGSLTGKQNVRTYTVGFETNQTLLKETAEGTTATNVGGGGKYYLANDTDSLKTAFNDIVREVVSVNTTFVSPGVAVNSFNRLNHRDELYFSVFKPDKKPSWTGNLKRYKLGHNGAIYDVNDNAAVNSSTGFFEKTSRSWWSSVDDGDSVSIGGAAWQQPTPNSNRKVYTYYTGASSKTLSDTTNAVNVANKSNLTKAMFGDATMSDSDHERLINWTRGADVFDVDLDKDTTDARPYIADPLHSVPHLVTYGGTNASPDITVYFGDNQGYLHAIKGKTGESYFSFIPEEFLANQSVLMNNSSSVAEHPYGMDGSVASWVYDKNADIEIKATDGDHAYIYIGQRRGGRNYYALDVTDRDNPKILWKITGGTGDFAELGQSWSKPVKTKIDINGKITDVIVISGGYDTQQDSVTTRTTDTTGRALYILNATTGARIWWAGPSGSGADLELADMNYSIPATPKVLDVSGDGAADQIYVGDMGGQLWRFDIYNGSAARSLVTAGVIADLAGSTNATNRRFYHTPDVFGLQVGTSRQLGLVIGSGWQAHPLDVAVEDRMYMIRIADATSPPDSNSDGVTDYTKLTEAKLFDTTLNLIQEGTATQQAAATTALDEADGWYIRLTRSGEKVLSSSQTMGGQVFITTYEPTPSTSNCVPSAGTPRLFHISASNGGAVKNYDGIGKDDELTRSDREDVLQTAGLPPNPQRMRIDGQDVICVGAECQPVSKTESVIRTYWYED